MQSIEVRPFRRADREQVTALVNAHVAAVIVGPRVSVNSVMSQLEREPGEFIVDPWVVERRTLVAEERGRVVAAAHLLRYGSGADVGESYRDVGEIRWFLFWPQAPAGSPYWRDGGESADALMEASLRQLETWGVTRRYADGALPAPAVYGVPAQWPHVRTLYEQAGFVHTGATEIVFSFSLSEPPSFDASPPLDGLSVVRSVGINGTRLTASVGDDAVGYIEVELLGESSQRPLQGGLADVGNLHVDEEHRRQGVATWLLAQVAEWLRPAGVGRLLDYAGSGDTDCIAFLHAAGFQELTRTRRGWAIPASAVGSLTQ